MKSRVQQHTEQYSLLAEIRSVMKASLRGCEKYDDLDELQLAISNVLEHVDSAQCRVVGRISAPQPEPAIDIFDREFGEGKE
jgi:hypothetical protein